MARGRELAAEIAADEKAAAARDRGAERYLRRNPANHMILNAAAGLRFFEKHSEPTFCALKPEPIRSMGGELPDCLVWEELGTDDNPRASLKSVWKIGGCSLSVRAIEADVVAMDHDGNVTRRGLQFDDSPEPGESDIRTVPVDGDEERMLALWNAFHMEGEPDFMVIDGRRYLVFACPVSG